MKVGCLNLAFLNASSMTLQMSYSKCDNFCSFHGFLFPKVGSPGIEVDKPEDRSEIG